jgi:hypothetical protein
MVILATQTEIRELLKKKQLFIKKLLAQQNQWKNKKSGIHKVPSGVFEYQN